MNTDDKGASRSGPIELEPIASVDDGAAGLRRSERGRRARVAVQLAMHGIDHAHAPVADGARVVCKGCAR